MSLLSPLDLLSVSSDEQDVLRCLTRRPELTTQEISKFTKIPLNRLEGLLNDMCDQLRITQDEKKRFQVAYAKQPKSAVSDSKNSILDRLFP